MGVTSGAGRIVCTYSCLYCLNELLNKNMFTLESVYRRRTDNTMTKRTSYKTYINPFPEEIQFTKQNICSNGRNYNELI
jgi:hypothetical protein